MTTCTRLGIAHAFLVFLHAGSLARAADRHSFELEASSPEPYSAAYLGNGAIGIETAASGMEATRSYLAGVYDQSDGDIARIAAVPAWNGFEIFDGSQWLDGKQLLREAEQYRQVLDMFDGILRTTYLWRSGQKAAQIEIEEFVSRDRADAAAVRLRITPQFVGRLGVRLSITNWPRPQRYRLGELAKLDQAATEDPWLIWYAGRLEVDEVTAQGEQGGALLSISARAPGYTTKIGEALALAWAGDDSKAALHVVQRNGADAEVTFDTKPSKLYTFTKFAAFANNDLGSVSRVTDKAKELRSVGWEQLFASHSAAWHRIWETDIEVTPASGSNQDGASLQRVVHSMLFYLLESSRENLGFSTPPMGLSSAGYYGHVFWDSDTFMFPPLALLHPEMARSMVSFRSRTREAAVANARANGFRGAMYPWEAGPDGKEVTPQFAIQNAKYENHINGDVALAAWQYWLLSGDKKWLHEDCWPILRDTADFWLSRVNYNRRLKRYEIGNVVAVKETDIGVSNDAYTNAVARRNLELASQAALQLHEKQNPKWHEVADKLYAPVTDSALLWFPLQLPLSVAQTRKALDLGESQALGGKPDAMMGIEFYPILAAQLGDQTRIGQFFKSLYQPFLRAPFNVVAETQANRNTSFLTGAGAFLQQLVFGYSGLRWGNSGLESKFRPVLPPGIQRLTLRNVVMNGKRQTLTFETALK